MRLRRYLTLPTAIALLCVASAARAQSADAMGGAHGIRLGEAMVLHLGLSVETGWDSNVFYEASNEHSSFYLRLNPNFDLTTRPRQGRRTVEFDLHGGLDYVEYLTGDPSISSHRQFNVDAGLLAAFFTMSPYNFVLFDNYVRSTQPPYVSGSENFNRDTNEVGIRVSLSPGGGRLTFNVGYLFGIDFFEPSALQDYNNTYHRFDLRGSWRFLPKTAVYIAATEYIYNYVNPGTTHPDSYPFRINAGLQGLITTKLTLNLWVGYGNGFYVSGPSPNTAIGGISATWKPTLLSTGTVGYQHDFQNSLLGSYYDEDAVYVSWTQLVWRFTGFLRAQYSNLRFQGVNQMVQATTNGTDNLVTINARVDYPFKDWLFLGVGYNLELNRTDRQIAMGPPPTPATVPVDYTKHVVYLRLTATY